jgi:hypothetical protein
MLGEWHSAQPVSLNACRPRVIDAEPPGTVDDGVGGARKRMKIVNFSTELNTPGGVVPSSAESLLGSVVKWHP